MYTRMLTTASFFFSVFSSSLLFLTDWLCTGVWFASSVTHRKREREREGVGTRKEKTARQETEEVWPEGDSVV